jgi:hypothetical protein
MSADLCCAMEPPLQLVAWRMKQPSSLFPSTLPQPSDLHEYYYLVIHSATKRNIGVTPDLVKRTAGVVVLVLAGRRILSARGDPCWHAAILRTSLTERHVEAAILELDPAYSAHRCQRSSQSGGISASCGTATRMLKPNTDNPSHSGPCMEEFTISKPRARHVLIRYASDD